MMQVAAIVCGRVVRGVGEGSRYVELYSEELRRALGCKPFPGTLNVALLTPETIEFVKYVFRRSSFVIPPPKPSLKPVYAVRAQILGISCLAIVPTASIHGFRVLEVVACKNLRKELSLEDGDAVCLELR